MDVNITIAVISIVATTGFSVAGYFINTVINRVKVLENHMMDELIERARTKGEIMAILREIQVSMATKDDINRTSIRLSVIETKLQAL